MRRLFVIPLVGVMLAILAVPVLAEENSGTLTITTEPKAIDVFGKRDEDTRGAGTVYSVDIKWGNMKAIYTPERTLNWNPETLTFSYLNDSDSKWTWDEPTSSNGLASNQITLINHSNTDITCTFQFLSGDDFSGISGIVTNEEDETENSISIKSAAETTGSSTAERLAQVTRSGFLQLSGELNTAQNEFQKIGTILVTLN